MTINQYVANDIVSIVPAGPFIAETVGAFSHAVTRRLDTGWDKLIVDLDKVDWIDSAGLGALVHAAMSAGRHGARLVIVHANPYNHALLMTRGAGMFELFDTTAAAERSFAGTSRRSVSAAVQ